LSERPTLCRVCSENCGILVKRDRRGTRIRGNPDHPVSRGFLCFRGKHYGEVHDADTRLDFPMVRSGSHWTKVSWEDALGILAERLLQAREEHGPESVVFYKGESLKHQEIARYLQHLSFGFGSPNYVSVGSLCHYSSAFGHALTYGETAQPDLHRIRLAILWGTNPAISAPRTFLDLKKAAGRGMKLIVVDPSRTQSASHADLHLSVRPGSDGFLALAFLKYALIEERVSPELASSDGWEELNRLLRRLSFSSLMEETGIEVEEFRKAASMIFESIPGWVSTGLGLELQPNGFQSLRAIACLQPVLDPQNRAAGFRAPLKPLPGSDRYPPMPPSMGSGRWPLYTRTLREGQGMQLTRAILRDDPYPVRAMLVAGGNPALTFPGTRFQTAAYEKLDFLAVVDLFMTPTARRAHLVLPAATFLETLELHDYGVVGKPYLGLVQPVAPSNKGRPAWQWIFDLARRLGLSALFPWKDNREALMETLSGTGVSLEDLEKSASAVLPYSPKVSPETNWRTRTGKVQFYSKELAALGYSGLPVPEDLRLPVSAGAPFPFWLSTGDRVLGFQHTQFRNAPTARNLMKTPILDIHPDSAARLGVRDGEKVAVTSRYGRLEIRAALCPEVRRDSLRMSHGWESCNANDLTDSEYFDPVTGFPWMRALPVSVEKIGERS